MPLDRSRLERLTGAVPFLARFSTEMHVLPQIHLSVSTQMGSLSLRRTGSNCLFVRCRLPIAFPLHKLGGGHRELEMKKTPHPLLSKCERSEDHERSK